MAIPALWWVQWSRLLPYVRDGVQAEEDENIECRSSFCKLTFVPVNKYGVSLIHSNFLCCIAVKGVLKLEGCDYSDEKAWLELLSSQGCWSYNHSSHHYTRDVGEQLTQQYQKEKEINRRMLLKVVSVSCICYLARQSLALRGDGDEQDGNFMQLLKLKGEDDPAVINWLQKINKYTSHEIQNGILNTTAMHVSRDITTCL